jgi:hypothetical protein
MLCFPRHPRRVLSAPERDPLTALWRLDPDVRACLCAAAVMGVLLLGVKGYFAALLWYAAALAPGLLLMRTAVKRHPSAATDKSLARSALAGLLGTLVIRVRMIECVAASRARAAPLDGRHARRRACSFQAATHTSSYSTPPEASERRPRNARRRRGLGSSAARPARRASGPRAAFERHQLTRSRGARQLERWSVRGETRGDDAGWAPAQHDPRGARRAAPRRAARPPPRTTTEHQKVGFSRAAGSLRRPRSGARRTRRSTTPTCGSGQPVECKTSWAARGPHDARYFTCHRASVAPRAP